MAQVTNITVTQSRTTKNVYRVKNYFLKKKVKTTKSYHVYFVQLHQKEFRKIPSGQEYTESTNRKLEPANLPKKAAGKEGR